MKALVTGASSGIGKALAYELASYQIDLVLVARRESILEKMKEEMEYKYKINVEIEAVDITNLELLDQMINRHQDITILVNNAGVGKVGLFDEISINDDMAMIDLNIKSFHYILKKYHELFVTNNKGYILNVASIASFQPGPKMATYYASKSYELSISEAIAYEDKKNKRDIKTCCLCPSSVESEFDKNANVKHSLHQQKASDVAFVAVKSMFKGKTIIFPSTFLAIRVFFLRLLSRNFVKKIVYRVQSKKQK